MRQVVVVGAGPIGSYLASLLAGKGIDTVIVEEHDAVGKPVNCTGIIGCKAFEEFDLNEDSIVSSISEISMLSPSGERISYSRESPLAQVVCRTQYDRYLAEKAVNKGAELRLGIRVKAVEQDDKGVNIYCSGGANLRSQVCLLATGSLSNLPYRMGLGKPKQFMLGAQIEGILSPIEHTEVFVNQEFAPGFFSWAVPIREDGLCRIGLCAPENSSRYMKKYLQWISTIKNLDLQGKKPSFSRIPVGLCKRSYHGRIAALGDAASQVKPTTGGGLYYGMKGADALAECLTPAVFEKSWNPECFASYEKKWKKILGRELKTGYLFKELITKSDNERLDRIICEIKKETQYQKIFPHADFDYHSRMILKMLANPFLTGLLLASAKDWLVGKILSR